MVDLSKYLYEPSENNENHKSVSFQYASQTHPTSLSNIEEAITKSKVPLELRTSNETINVNGQSGVWLNKHESINWQGPMPLSKYAINTDPNPEIIVKAHEQNLVYNQEILVRYLRPPTPPAPGDIIIKQLKNTQAPPPPPLVIHQVKSQNDSRSAGAPLVFREVPPKPPMRLEPKIINIPKKSQPLPRKIIIERLAPLPKRPRPIIIERWLPPRIEKRKVLNAADNVKVKSTKTTVY